MAVCLGRQIRFYIDFNQSAPVGWDSYSGRPSGSGLCLWVGLWIKLKGLIDPQTGFLVNVSEIDRLIRPIFLENFQAFFRQPFLSQGFIVLDHVGLFLSQLANTVGVLFKPLAIEELSLEVSPYRGICVKPKKEVKSMFFRQRFEFSAMHQLWNDRFSHQQNFQIFGKCANLAGHGHNYWLDVVVERPIASVGQSVEQADWIADFEKTVYDHFLSRVDHKNLNCDVAGFDKNPTVENLVIFAWECLEKKFKDARLVEVILWENDRTYCSYQGERGF